MTQVPRLSIALLILTLASPLGAASWNALGSSEPSTMTDRTAHLMFMDAPSHAGTRVYFNGFTSWCVPPYLLVCTPAAANPNVAALGTAVETYPTLFGAMLGVWRDCNADGYVGLGETGAFEYRAELLVASGATECTVANDGGASHNDGAWVRELLPIGATEALSDPTADAQHYEDADARVWADWGDRGAVPGYGCYLFPQPAGTLHHTDGTLVWLDCYNAGRLTLLRNAVEDSAGLDVPDVRNPWGDARDDSFVEWDCGTEPILTTPDAGSGNLTLRNGHAAADPSKASPAGTINAAEAGTSSNCTRSSFDEFATLPYATEGDVQDTMSVRTHPDHAFAYVSQARLEPGVVGVRSTPSDGGARSASFGGLWRSLDVTAASRNPFIDRDTLGFASVTYVSYYAYVSAGSVSRFGFEMPGSAVAAYGAENCGGATWGVRNGWDCEAADWQPATEHGAVVGAPYDLLDVDCDDTSTAALRDAGVSYGALTSSNCV